MYHRRLDVLAPFYCAKLFALFMFKECRSPKQSHAKCPLFISRLDQRFPWPLCIQARSSSCSAHYTLGRFRNAITPRIELRFVGAESTGYDADGSFAFRSSLEPTLYCQEMCHKWVGCMHAIPNSRRAEKINTKKWVQHCSKNRRKGRRISLRDPKSGRLSPGGITISLHCGDKYTQPFWAVQYNFECDRLLCLLTQMQSALQNA